MKNKSSNDLIFIKEKLSSSNVEASNDIRELKMRMELNHPNLQQLKGHSSQVKRELCSTHYITRGFYEFPKSDMLKEIQEHSKQNIDFQPEELHSLCIQVL